MPELERRVTQAALVAGQMIRRHAMLWWAAVVGLLGALATMAFRDCLGAAQTLLTGHSGSFVAMARGLPWPSRLLFPCVGGAIAGAILLLARRLRSERASDYMEAVAIGEGQVSIRQTLLRSASSLCTIASGGSIGREGSMIQLAAMSAAAAGRWLRLEPARLRLLVACGAAAGITSAYNAPIAGAFFVTEIVLGAIVMESFGPIVIAAVTANITMRALPGYRPTYEMPAFPPIAGYEVLLFLALGLLAGALTPHYLRLLTGFRHAFQRSGLALPVQLAGAGLLVGLLSIWVPEVWGNGYSVVNSLLHQPWLWSSVLLILLSKVVATALTTGSGAIGGVFTPTLFVGAALGTLFAQGAHALWPALASASYAYAMVGMGACLAAATGAPLMAIFMIFEMTLSYQIMLPLMLACVFAYFVARALDAGSIYEITIQRNRHQQAMSRLRATQMADLIQPAVTVLPVTARFDEAAAMFLRYPVKYLYLVDRERRLRGVVAAQDVTAALLEKDGDGARSLAPLLRREFLHVLTPDMTLDQALQHFLTHQGERLPVVRTLDDPQLLGAISKSALLDAYARLLRARLSSNAE